MMNFFYQQNKMLEKIFSQALARGVFPGAALAVFEGRRSCRHRLIQCFGHTSYREKERQLITQDTFFDLASLTKPLATLPALLTLITAGKFDFGTTLEDLLKSKVPRDKKNITLEDLLTHRSGLPAYLPFFKLLSPKKDRDINRDILQHILSQPLVYPTGSRSLYSDPGFILAGFIVERHSGKNLAACIEEDVYRPLGLEDKLFFNYRGRVVTGIYAPGEYCLWRQRLLRGEVGDENCALMGGVAGHAGLFGNITAVAKLLEFYLDLGWSETAPGEGNPLIKREYFLRCCRRWDETAKNTWAAGFDTPSPGYSSAGPYMSSESIGHLGFSGTSCWLDPQKHLFIILLSNRVHPCRSNDRIKKFRPQLHKKIMEEAGLAR